MRLVTYDGDGTWRAGIVVHGAVVVDARAAARAAGLSVTADGGGGDVWTSIRPILGMGAAERDRLQASAGNLARDAAPGDTRPRADACLGPPVLDPEKIICLGLNYRDHAVEASLATPDAPMLFAKFRNSLVGPASPIVLPRISRQIDYEGELAVVIGRPCKDVPTAEALDYVAGVMVFNDVSARDVQLQTSQWMAGKALDTFAPCGPELVTLDEVADVQDLTLTTRVNGETVQRATTAGMIFPVAETVSFISRLMTLEPGDIIATGTPEGVGFKRTPPLFLRDGDVVEVEIAGVGLLRNPVVDPVPSAAVG